jgi:hypothetical protein
MREAYVIESQFEASPGGKTRKITWN